MVKHTEYNCVQQLPTVADKTLTDQNYISATSVTRFVIWSSKP